MKVGKNIIIITPFYPISHRKDLDGDTKAIYYLLKTFSKDNNLLIIHSFLHRFKSTYKNIFKLLSLGKYYKDYQFKDDYGNKLLFFENMFLLPKRDYILNYFNKKYSKIVKDFCHNEDYSPHIGIVHFPTYYEGFVKKLDIIPKKIAILHSVDIKKIKKNPDINSWSKYFNSFDAIGFRSYVIKKEFEGMIRFKKKTFLCLSGIPTEFLNISFKEKSYSQNQVINLIYAGKLDKNKNVDKTIRALHRLKPEFKFIFNILGEGTERPEIDRITNQLGLGSSINFVGTVPREKVFDSMRNNDIFVMVSKKETLGLVYMEAMAAGCIVVGSKGQGIDGIIIDGKNGFLAESDNLENIYETIKKVMSLTIKEQIQIKENAKQTIGRMSDIELSKLYFNNIISVINEDVEECQGEEI